MKDYNLPDLNSRNGDSKQLSTSSKHGRQAMKDDYCIDTSNDLLNSSSLQMLQRINNLPSASVSPLPIISLEKDFSSAENTLHHNHKASNKG